MEAQLEVSEVENDVLRLVCAQAVKCVADAWQSHAEVVALAEEMREIAGKAVSVAEFTLD